MSVENTKKTREWDFPETSKSNRILTGHYINLVYTIPKGPLALFSFLIYQSEEDNSFRYTTKLLNQYRTAIEMVQEKYIKKRLGVSQPTTRRYFKYLIEYGFIFPIKEKKYLINPNLTHHRNIKPAKLKEWRLEQTVENWLKQD